MNAPNSRLGSIIALQTVVFSMAALAPCVARAESGTASGKYTTMAYTTPSYFGGTQFWQTKVTSKGTAREGTVTTSWADLAWGFSRSGGVQSFTLRAGETKAVVSGNVSTPWSPYYFQHWVVVWIQVESWKPGTNRREQFESYTKKIVLTWR